MKCSKNLVKKIDELLTENHLSSREIINIKSYSEDLRIYVLMLFPNIPFPVRSKSVSLYKRFINPSCKLPFYLVNKIVCNLVETKEDYIKLLKDIYDTELIIY